MDDQRKKIDNQRKKILGSRIKARLEYLGKTPKELAEYCGVNLYIVYRWTQGFVFPSYYNLFKVAEFLSCSILFLFQEDEGFRLNRDQVRALSLIKERLGLLYLKMEKLNRQASNAIRSSERNK